MKIEKLCNAKPVGSGGRAEMFSKFLPGAVPKVKGVKKTMKYGVEIHNPWLKRSVFFWCLHCERTYRQGECREINGLQMCPYDGCNGDTVCDAWPWEDIRSYNPQYPVIPEEGKVYPMYPEAKKVKNPKGKK
jgi:hypothetical protein